MPMIFSSSSAAWAATTRFTGAEETGVLDDGVLGDGSRQVVLKELFHLGGVGAGAAKEGRRLKGASASAHGKVLGVQHDARQQGLRLGPEKLVGLHNVLEQLRDKFRGGGGVRLVVVERGPLDIGGGPAVVVDDRHPVAGLEQLLRLDLLGSIGVHHNSQGPGIGDEQGILWG